MIGIGSANQATKEAAATANGLAGIFGYVGSFLSAIGVGIIADHYGWNVVFYLIIGVGVLGAITFLTMWMAPRDGYARAQKFYALEAHNVAEAEENVADNSGNAADTDV